MFCQVIKLLLQTGAHLTESPKLLAENLVSAAASNNVTRLQSFKTAGCDMNIKDICDRTALHAVNIYF